MASLAPPRSAGRRSPVPLFLAVVLAGWTTLGCLGGEAPSLTDGAGSDGVVAADLGVGELRTVDAWSASHEGRPTCKGTPLKVFDEKPGTLLQLAASLPTQSGSAPFLIDTGSAWSFVFGTQNLSTELCCVSVSLPHVAGKVGWQLPDGTTPAGLLGSDLVSEGATLDLRIGENRLFWWRDPPEIPTAAARVPLEYRPIGSMDAGLVASEIYLDGKKVRLMLDTGSPHVLIMSATPRPKEVEVHTFDGMGNPVTLYTSTIKISFAGGPERVVAVDRAETFPVLEQTIVDLGGDVAGLLGLSALGHQRIVLGRGLLAFLD
jgi:hypothetical protein